MSMHVCVKLWPTGYKFVTVFVSSTPDHTILSHSLDLLELLSLRLLFKWKVNFNLKNANLKLVTGTVDKQRLSFKG